MGKRYYSFLIAVYIAGLALCGSSRVLLKLRFIDPVTGFYSMQNGIVMIFQLSLLVTVALLLIASRLRKPASDYPIQRDSRLRGLLALLTGVSIAAYSLFDQIYPVMEQGYSDTLLQIRGNAALALGLLAALALIWLGAGGLLGSVSSAVTIPALLPGLWQAYILVTRFNSYTVLTTISDNLLAVLFMVFASLFLVGQARVTFGLARKDGRNYTIPTGFCASLTGFVLVLPNYLYAAMNGGGLPALMLGVWESVYVLMLSVYALVFTLGMIRSIRQV